MLALSGLLLLIAFYLSGGRAILVGMVPTVFAANEVNARANSDCTNEHHNPSFAALSLSIIMRLSVAISPPSVVKSLSMARFKVT